MTLFGAVCDDPIFAKAISAYLGGKPDQATLLRLQAMDRK
jgi:hypothetical protein